MWRQILKSAKNDYLLNGSFAGHGSYEKCLVFCPLSNAPNFEMIWQLWFFAYRWAELGMLGMKWSRDSPPWTLEYRKLLKHAQLNFIHTCESWSSFIKLFLDYSIFSPLSPWTVNKIICRPEDSPFYFWDLRSKFSNVLKNKIE